MGSCKTLIIRTTLMSCIIDNCNNFVRANPSFSNLSLSRLHPPSHLRNPGFISLGAPLKRYRSFSSTQLAVSVDPTDLITLEEQSEELNNKDTVEQLLTKRDKVSAIMKMERRPAGEIENWEVKRWFPYLNEFKAGKTVLSSCEVLEALDPYISDVRKNRFRSAVKNRSYSVCLVVEGLSDFGNVSAVFRSADAFGIQSLHVVSCDSSKRFRENRHVSMGAEKWLDIELWDSIEECFDVLRSRGYRIATTHVGINAVSVHDMDWTCPTAIVVGNENRGISDEALNLSDLHCSIPMKGMVDSFNVSVAAGILMHNAVCDRTSRMGYHGDLTPEESQILLAEFSLRHSISSISIAHEYAKRKLARPTSML